MTEKPKYASGYDSGQVALVKATCLSVAATLGELMEELVVVGGLVPSLIIDQSPRADLEPHVGTMDLDVGIALGLLDGSRYELVADRLRAAGFAMDVNEEQNATRQRWTRDHGRIGVDFLIPPASASDRGGELRRLGRDLAAIIAPGLELAFRDRRRVPVEGQSIWVCEAGAYVVLKALAFDVRRENKDAYDLYYVVQNYGSDPRDVAARLAPLRESNDTKKAISIMQRDFIDAEAIGPRRVAEFLRGGRDAEVEADVRGFVDRLVTLL